MADVSQLLERLVDSLYEIGVLRWFYGLKFFAQWVKKSIFEIFFNKNSYNFVIFLPIFIKMHMTAQL